VFLTHHKAVSEVLTQPEPQSQPCGQKRVAQSSGE
jgi:hypothetical protein